MTMSSRAAPAAAASRTGRIGPARPVRLQIALSVEERQRLEERAVAADFESVAAFIRARTLLDGPRPAA